jgi:hypothetical protein
MKTPPTANQSIGKALVAIAAAVGIIIFLLWYTKHRKGPEMSLNQLAPHVTATEKAAFFERSVVPILDANASANAKALENLKTDIHKQFEQYRQRVPIFTDDITGFGNKTKITWEATKQMASDDKDKVKRHVAGKFEMHVVSAEKMQSELETLLHGFRRDIEANNNRMLVDIDAAVKNDPRFSALGIKVPESFAKQTEADISAASLQAGKDAVTLSGMTFLVSFATEEAVRSLVTLALTRVGASLATSMGATAAASGGATVAGGAGGGATGTLGGPAGIVIGIAAGLTVGIIVDYVMTERMEDKLNEECTMFLTKAETEIAKKPDGLVFSLEKAIIELDKIRVPIVKQQIEALP